MQFVNHLLKELVDESLLDVALTGCCKIIQKFTLLLIITNKEIIFLIRQAVCVV